MRPLILLLLGLCAFPAQATQLLPMRINGLDPLLEAHVRAAIALPEAGDKAVEISEGRLAYYVGNINRQVEDSLEPLSYYGAKVSSRLEREGEAVRLVLDVAPGSPVTVRQRNLRMDGAAGGDRFIGFWLESFEPAEGQPFVHGIYEDNKAAIGQALLDRGYFDQRNTVHAVRVTRAAGAADIDLAWDSGPRYRYGAVRFEGHGFEPGLLDKLVDFERGKPYSQPQINRLQESLGKLDYFSSIQIVPELSAKQDGEVPILVNLTRAQRTNQHASARFGTKTGFGVEYGVERRWINRRGHKLDANAAWAQNEQSFTTLYRIPAFQWLDGWYGIGLVARNEEYTGSNSRYLEAVFSRSGQIRKWELLASVNVRRERFDEFIPDVDQNVPFDLYTSVLYPEFNAVWRDSDDPNYPRDGRAWHYQLRTGYEFSESKSPFVQAGVKHKRVLGLDNGNRLLLRAELGAIWTPDYALFPPSLRYYAGGDQSVRGYGYKEIGQYIGSYNFGGRYLAVASAEYEYRLNPEWAVAGFIDVGDAFDRKPSAHLGIGAGARWRSPIGPVRFDLAYGFDGPKPGIGIHFAIGPDL